MGYDGHGKGIKKADILNHFLSKRVWFDKDGHHSQEIVKHSNTKDGVWAIWEKTNNGKVVDRSLGLILFARVKDSADVGWATKVISEAEGPLYYNVPKNFLKEHVTDKNEAWRKDVAKAHEASSRDTLRWNKIRNMIKEGDKVYFGEGVKLEYGTFVRFWKKSFLVKVGGVEYRAGKSVVDVDKTLLDIRMSV